MNFFKSVFADDDPEPDPQSPQSSPKQQPLQPEPEPEPESEDQSTAPPTWGFVGGLIKTFATKSESVIETYRRDLQEFSSGLKIETQVFKEVASSSLEVGASKAQESLESVGQAIDNIGSVVWKSTAQIIAQGSDSDLENPDSSPRSNPGLNLNPTDGRKYSRFDAQLRGIQCDVNTYVEEFEDVGEFEKWKSSFYLGEKSEEMGNLMRENGVMEGIYKRVVPNLVDHDLFWFRYYFRVYKLEQAESVRAKLVERANEDEELSWDVDDDEDDEVKHEEVGGGDNVGEEEKGEKVKDEGGVVESNEGEAKTGGNEEEEVKKKNVDEKTPSEGSKDSDITVVSTQPSRGEEEEEEDLGWDEIEDLGSDDDVGEKKGKQTEGGGGSPSNREELRKRLSVAEDDEDLSWDIEDDDEPIKKS
ncbi:BSD domain-containing protein 1-like [Chenopodium quinoa]|uniref:BSD domain-containing protein 1-like n=1 Tax=Chenopodium quinoa TaxID=63459 RepID=UPI000B7720EA|nr:BSD domain-containing protein 1-like [Chenopodium quinoa]